MTIDDQLAELLVRWKASRERGAPLTPEELCRDCPNLLAEFRERLPAFAAIDGLFEGTEIDEPGNAGEYPDFEGYCSLRLHGQGGLGLVFEAEDLELHRKVAIKRMKARVMVSPDAKERFINEAEITARLDHPGVVPIYRGGHDQAGQPYYAMRFVQGPTLSDAIEQHYSNYESATNSAAGNDKFRRLLRCLIGVCQTIAYAHDRGVVHRDLKPENVMLGSFGEVLVIDWGLAKRFNVLAATEETATETESSSTPHNQTMQGTVKGSPAYMSPEQAHGETLNIGPASDIYSLGAMLYVLLTGQPPYTGATALEIVAKVKAGPCVSPAQLNRKIPKALAAVCNKAMSHVRDDRYQSALEMARDLERWLDDEPVGASPDPLYVQVRRWLKLHSKLATAMAVAMVLSTIAMAIFVVQANAANKVLSEAHVRWRQATIAIAGSRNDSAALDPTILDALASARTYFRRMADSNRPEFLAEAAVLENLEGAMHLRRGDYAAAQPCFERALDEILTTLERDPRNPVFREVSAIISTNLGCLAVQHQDFVTAIPLLNNSLDVISDLANRGIDTPSLQMTRLRNEHALAICHMLHGMQYFSNDELSTADEEYQRAQELLAPLVEHPSDFPEIRGTWSGLLGARASLLRQKGKIAIQRNDAAGAVKFYEKALQLHNESKVTKSKDVTTAISQAFLHEDTESFVQDLISACQLRLEQLDVANSGQRAEAERLLNLGIESLESLSTVRLRIRKDLVALYDELLLRLGTLTGKPETTDDRKKNYYILP